MLQVFELSTSFEPKEQQWQISHLRKPPDRVTVGSKFSIVYGNFTQDAKTTEMYYCVQNHAQQYSEI